MATTPNAQSQAQLPEILASCRFYLELSLDQPDGSPAGADAYFMECKGFKRTQEVIEACEVTAQKWGSVEAKAGLVVRTKIPGNVKISNVTLRRGMTSSRTLWNWFDAIQSGKRDQQRDGSLTIYDQSGNAQARFSFQRAWPTGYLLTDVNAGSNEIEIEEIELAVEEFKREEIP